MDSNAKKLVIAVVALVLAGVVVAWQLGVFSGGGSSTPTSEDVQETYTPEEVEDLQDDTDPNTRTLPPPPPKPR